MLELHDVVNEFLRHSRQRWVAWVGKGRHGQLVGEVCKGGAVVAEDLGMRVLAVCSWTRANCVECLRLLHGGVGMRGAGRTARAGTHLGVDLNGAVSVASWRAGHGSGVRDGGCAVVGERGEKKGLVGLAGGSSTRRIEARKEGAHGVPS